jgi:hypothetical protein
MNRKTKYIAEDRQGVKKRKFRIFPLRRKTIAITNIKKNRQVLKELGSINFDTDEGHGKFLDACKKIQKNWSHIVVSSLADVRNGYFSQIIYHLGHYIHDIWKKVALYCTEKFCKYMRFFVSQTLALLPRWSVHHPLFIVDSIHVRDRKRFSYSRPLAFILLSRVVQSRQYLFLPGEAVAAICLIASKTEDVRALDVHELVQGRVWNPKVILRFEAELLVILDYNVYKDYACRKNVCV